MARNLLFHIGDPKTGSSAIQGTLFAKSWSSDSASLFYPGSLAQIFLARTLYDKSVMGKQKSRFTAVARQVNKSKADVAVISAEHFNNVPPKRMKKAIETYFPDHADDVRIIAYVRPHAERLVAAFAQRIKSGIFTGSLAELHEEMLQRKRLMYYHRFRNWKDVFGERFTLRPFIKEQLKNNNVVHDFLDFALLGAPVSIQEKTRANRSMSVEDLAMLVECHRIIVDKTGGSRRTQLSLGSYFSEILSAMPSERQTKVAPDHALADKLLATYAEDAAALDRDFFPDQSMTRALYAARDNAVENPQNLSLEDHYTKPQIREIRLWCGLVGEMLCLNTDDWAKIFRQKQQQDLLGNRQRSIS